MLMETAATNKGVHFALLVIHNVAMLNSIRTSTPVELVKATADSYFRTDVEAASIMGAALIYFAAFGTGNSVNRAPRI
jgi:hypothetical protein